MRASSQLKLDSIVPVLRYFRQFPDPAPAAVAALGRLQAVFEKVRALLGARLKAQQELSAAGAGRDGVTPRLRADLVHLVRIAGVAAVHEGLFELRVSLRPGRLTRHIPRDAGRVALEASTRYREVLIRYGMPEEMLARIRRDLDRHCAVLEARAAASAAIAETNLELALLAEEARLIIKHLDALTRLRFAEDPERLVIWGRVQAVPRKPVRRRGQDEAGSSPVAGQ
jgi:hypothetical protein